MVTFSGLLNFVNDFETHTWYLITPYYQLQNNEQFGNVDHLVTIIRMSVSTIVLLKTSQLYLVVYEHN